MFDGTFEIFSPHVTIYVCHCLLVLYPEQLYIMVLNLSLNMWTHKQLFTDIYIVYSEVFFFYQIHCRITICINNIGSAVHTNSVNQKVGCDPKDV